MSNTLESTFCLQALDEALGRSRPEIFNTDQVSQFTSEGFTSRPIGDRIAISMDGWGRATDNVFFEQAWQSVKYEDIYLQDYANGADVNQGLTNWFDLYTHRRPQQGLGGRPLRRSTKACNSARTASTLSNDQSLSAIYL